MRKLVGLAVSGAILGVIYWRIDAAKLVDALGGSDLALLALGLVLMAVPVALGAWRLTALTPDEAGLELGEATRLILVGGALNMALPSKMGDIAKAYFIAQRGHLSGRAAVSLVVFEKGWDMLALLFFCAFGLAIYPGKGALYWTLTAFVVAGLATGLLILGSLPVAERVFGLTSRILPDRFAAGLAESQTAWRQIHCYFWADKNRAARVVCCSLAIWFVHLTQIWVFVLALDAWLPFDTNLGLAPLAILAGLLPFTFAGIGTRDAALIFLYQPFVVAPTAAALGLLCTLRYVVPALAGLPFLTRYLGAVRAWRDGAPTA
jgi:hypothetical protein